jgi:hypothetical protein
MIRRLMIVSLFALVLAAPFSASAEEPKPDDTVAFDLSADDWVSTKTARVTIDVEAAVNASNEGTTRDDMIKSVNSVAKGDWRLIGFNRAQDNTGLERWSATFEARLPESALNGIQDTAKKAGHAGMQLTVNQIDFSPTLDETETVRANLRLKLIKEANDQLTTLNATLPGRNYRLSGLSFDGAVVEPAEPVAVPMAMRRVPGPMMAMASVASSAPAPSIERSEQITMQAHVVYAASPQQSSQAH